MYLALNKTPNGSTRFYVIKNGWFNYGHNNIIGSHKRFVIFNMVRGRSIKSVLYCSIGLEVRKQRYDGPDPNCVQLYGSYTHSRNDLLPSIAHLWTVSPSFGETVDKCEH